MTITIDDEDLPEIFSEENDIVRSGEINRHSIFINPVQTKETVNEISPLLRHALNSEV